MYLKECSHLMTISFFYYWVFIQVGTTFADSMTKTNRNTNSNESKQPPKDDKYIDDLESLAFNKEVAAVPTQPERRSNLEDMYLDRLMNDHLASRETKDQLSMGNYYFLSHRSDFDDLHEDDEDENLKLKRNSPVIPRRPLTESEKKLIKEVVLANLISKIKDVYAITTRSR